MLQLPPRIDRAASAVDRLHAAGRLRRLAEAEELRAIADLAAEHEWTTDDELDVLGERAVRIGATGTPLVGEFLPMEVAAATGVSVESATWLIRDVLNLHHRHPRLWRSVLQGHVTARQAFQLTQLTSRYDLTVEQAASVDDRLSPKYGRIGWPRLLRLARGLIALVAADKVAAAVEQARRSRFVRTSRTSEPLVSELWARLDSADAQQLEVTVQQIATTLKRLGDGNELEVRRGSRTRHSGHPQPGCRAAGGSRRRALPAAHQGVPAPGRRERRGARRDRRPGHPRSARRALWHHPHHRHPGRTRRRRGGRRQLRGAALDA
ncbi:hypothetical protein [Micropruina sp.]|uniref:hypothetical protein n=1 Tax=Micropruina sp. TaxID=2737536 RepID=UPI0039E318EA